MQIVIRKLDHTGHTQLDTRQMPQSEVEAQFKKMIAPKSESGLGMFATVGSTLNDQEHVRTWDALVKVEKANTEAGRETLVTVRPQSVGG